MNISAFSENDFVASFTLGNSPPIIFNEHLYNNEVLVVKSPRISLKRVDGEIHIELGNYHITILYSIIYLIIMYKYNNIKIILKKLITLNIVTLCNLF